MVCGLIVLDPRTVLMAVSLADCYDREKIVKKLLKLCVLLLSVSVKFKVRTPTNINHKITHSCTHFTYLLGILDASRKILCGETMFKVPQYYYSLLIANKN